MIRSAKNKDSIRFEKAVETTSDGKGGKGHPDPLSSVLMEGTCSTSDLELSTCCASDASGR
jgi:hypothetical protein